MAEAVEHLASALDLADFDYLHMPPIDLPENVVPSSSVSIASFKFLPSITVFVLKKRKDFLSPSLKKFGTRIILGSN